MIELRNKLGWVRSFFDRDQFLSVTVIRFSHRITLFRNPILRVRLPATAVYGSHRTPTSRPSVQTDSRSAYVCTRRVRARHITYKFCLHSACEHNTGDIAKATVSKTISAITSTTFLNLNPI